MKADKYTRAQVLGMPLDTAERKLRRKIMWELLRLLGQHTCGVCGGSIEAPDELALRHRKDWLEDAALFWDPQNIFFTHTGCQPHRETMNATLQITISTSSSGDICPIHWNGDKYIPVRYGDTFTIRLYNPNSFRVLAVTTVDGRNIVSGESGTLSGPGYVLNPYQSVVLTGWRESSSHTAAFKFCDVRDSYASQVSGSSSNVGVIGVAFFKETPTPKTSYTSTFGGSTPFLNFGGSSNSLDITSCVTRSVCRSAVPQSVGTGYGSSISSPSRETTFKRENSPFQLASFFYDTAEALRARGVPVADPQVHAPNPFPEDRFVKPPPRRV